MVLRVPRAVVVGGDGASLAVESARLVMRRCALVVWRPAYDERLGCGEGKSLSPFETCGSMGGAPLLNFLQFPSHVALRTHPPGSHY